MPVNSLWNGSSLLSLIKEVEIYAEAVGYLHRNKDRIQVRVREPGSVIVTAREAYSTAKNMGLFRQACKEEGIYLCLHCGGTDHLHIHHIIPVSVRPDLADDFNNMCVLCRKHHFRIGHMDLNWQTYCDDPYYYSTVVHKLTIRTKAHE